MKTFTKIIWALSGVLLVSAGVFCLCNPGSALISLAYVLGGITLAAGICSLVSYFLFGAGMLGGGWMLADGFITLLLGILLLVNEVLVANVLPFLFGMWIFVSGLTRFILAFDLKRAGAGRWWITFLESILCVVLGVISFLQPVAGAVAISIFVGVYLLVSGISTFCDLVFVHRSQNYFRELRRKLDRESDIIDTTAEDNDKEND